MRLFIGDDTEGLVNPDPERLADLVKGNRDNLCIIVGTSDALITLSRDDTCMTVYAPSEELLELIRAIAGAMQLFVWKPAVQSDL